MTVTPCASLAAGWVVAVQRFLAATGPCRREFQKRPSRGPVSLDTMVVHVGDSCLVANVKSGPRGLDAAPGAIRLLAGILQKIFSQLPRMGLNDVVHPIGNQY